MVIKLFLLLFLTDHVFVKETPDVDCLIVHLRYVHCSWKEQATPGVNYTFYSRFHNYENMTECPNYLSENNTHIGCNQPYRNMLDRFFTFYTKLDDGGETLVHDLKEKVKLYPPANLTVQVGIDSNLWFYWNQTRASCVESEIRYRVNNKDWDSSQASSGLQSFCINLPSKKSQYELQVRSRIGNDCGRSIFWSGWSDSVIWGLNNSKDGKPQVDKMYMWTAVLSVLGTLVLILLVIMLLHYERVRIILLPVVPKPLLISHDIQDWLQISKGLKENFNYNERACPVSEYCHVSQSDSESSDSAVSSVPTDQTSCSVLILSDESDLSTSCSSTTSTVLVPSEQEDKVSVTEAS